MGNKIVVMGGQPSLPLRADAITPFIATTAGLEIELAKLDQTGEYLAQPVQLLSIVAIPAVVKSATNVAAAAT
jgi:hypothetical protein